MSNEQIKEKLIEAGIRNLKEFGYPHVDSQNILTDIIYSGMFKSMLNDNLDKSTAQVDDVIEELLNSIKS